MTTNWERNRVRSRARQRALNRLRVRYPKLFLSYYEEELEREELDVNDWRV